MHFRILGCLLLGVISLSAETVLTWQPVDLEFEAQREYDWWEFPAKATFTHTSDSEAGFQVEAFWNGKKDWVIRTTFPKAGTWTWRTESSDPGLNHKQGTIEVRSPQPADVESNANLRGSLRIATGNRHFEYADGTPLFLLASTLWAGNTARCGLGDHEDGPFYQHLADRKAKGFNTILMQYFHGYGDYPESLGHRNEGGKPYTNIESKELNPDFFKYLDQRMQALWNQGFVAAIPTTWWGKSNNCVFNPQDAQRMSAYCAVRYGAFNSIWSLSGEYQYAFKDCGWTPEDFTTLGEVVQLHNPFKRPLSIHPSGQTKWETPHHVQSSLPFHGESWLDHHWLQTGQSRDRLYNMVTRMAENRALEPPTPIFLSEAFYERPGDPEGAYTSRWQVWTSLINGAAGFGYGAFGLWQFYDPDDPAEETGKFTGREVPWWEAQLFQGSSELQHVKAALSKVNWKALIPATDRLRVDGKLVPSPTPEDISPPQAAAIGKDTWILYIPRGNAGKLIEIPIEGKLGRSGTWIDPRSGSNFSSTTPKQANGFLTVPKLPLPQAEDWVFILDTLKK
jgi:hypothetical protein